MEKENDSPTTDSIAFLEAQGIPTDDEDDDDIHFCKKCKQVFNKIEAYLEHKVKHENFKVAYNRASGDRRMVLPTLVKKDQPDTAQTQSTGDRSNKMQNNMHVEDDSGTGQKKRRRRKKKMSHLDVQLIAEKSTYICTKCDRKFNREASLKWHLQSEHSEDKDKDDDDDDGMPDYSDDAQDENYVDKSFVAVKRHKTDDDYGSRPFVCDVCNLKFRELPVLKAHMLTHSNVRQYRCTYEGCPYAFKTKGSLTRHIRRHTGERPYTCEACGRKFAESGALTRHMRARNPCTAKTDADLPRYGKKWAYVPNIPAVVGNGDGEGEFLPMVPGDTVTLVQEGEDGEQIITQAQIISSGEDVGAFEIEMEEGEIKESEVEDASSDFENLTSTQCRVCKEECSEIEALRIHLRTHLADLNFRCSLCHFVAETREELQTHLQCKHLSQMKGIDANSLLPSQGASAEKPRQKITSKIEREAQTAVKQLLELAQEGSADIQVQEEPLSVRAICRCPVCNRAFRGASYMRQHMKSHTGDRPHVCSICPKSFTTKDALNKHLVVHTDDRNFKCGVCGKLFKRIGHVKEHLKIHNSDRPFPCTFCDKSFKTHNALKVHVRTHSDVFPYECRICHRHFREKGSLQRHCRMHTGERPFHCHRCGRGFAEHGTLNRHLKAKVPCQGHPGSAHLEVEDSDSKQADQDSDVPTVLAEFSSVVADTQQYIVTDEISEEDQQTTEYVVLADEIQNVEIVTEGDIDPATILDTVVDSENSYVVVSEPGNSLRIIDSSTGFTIATMPADSDPLQAVAFMPATEVEAGSVMVQTGDTVSLVSSQHDGTVELHSALLVDAEALENKGAETIQSHPRMVTLESSPSEVVTLDSESVAELSDMAQEQEIVAESNITDAAGSSVAVDTKSSEVTVLSLAP